MRPFLGRTHALSHLRICLARTSHARVLFTWSHLAPALALQNSQYVPLFTSLKKRNNLMLNSFKKNLEEMRKNIEFFWNSCFFIFVPDFSKKSRFFIIYPRFISKNTFKSAVAPVRVRPAQKSQHARTSHAQFYWGFAPVRTPDSARTRATARTHARTLKLWILNIHYVIDQPYTTYQA